MDILGTGVRAPPSTRGWWRPSSGSSGSGATSAARPGGTRGVSRSPPRTWPMRSGGWPPGEPMSRSRNCSSTRPIRRRSGILPGGRSCERTRRRPRDRPCGTADPGRGLRSAFSPAAIAIVGASRTPGKMGHVTLRALTEAGFPGLALSGQPRRRHRARPARLSGGSRPAGVPTSPSSPCRGWRSPGRCGVRAEGDSGDPGPHVRLWRDGPPRPVGRAGTVRHRARLRQQAHRAQLRRHLLRAARVTWTPQADLVPGGVSFISQSGGLAYDLLRVAVSMAWPSTRSPRSATVRTSTSLTTCGSCATSGRRRWSGSMSRARAMAGACSTSSRRWRRSSRYWCSRVAGLARIPLGDVAYGPDRGQLPGVAGGHPAGRRC